MKTIVNNEQFIEQSFRSVAMPQTEFSGIEFEDCSFVDCDFSESTFRSCKFLGCTFVSCNLALLKVPYTRFFEVGFTECKLIGVDWTKANWPSFHLDADIQFSQCLLNDSSFFELTLHELKVEQCKLKDVDFRGGDFTDSAITYCDLSGSLFMRTNLQGVDFTESTGFSIDLLENKLNRAKFTRLEALALLDSLDIELVD